MESLREEDRTKPPQMIKIQQQEEYSKESSSNKEDKVLTWETTSYDFVGDLTYSLPFLKQW